MKIVVAPATVYDVSYVAEKMHPGHAAEVWALGRQSPLQALQQALAMTDQAFAARELDGTPVALVGIAGGVLDTTGSPWMLATMSVVLYPREMLHYGRAMLRDGFARQYSRYENEVWATYTPGVRYARHLGFEIGPETRNHYWEPVVPITMER